MTDDHAIAAKHNINQYEQSMTVLCGRQPYVVVKSQDQIQRRKRMLEGRDKGRFGRVKPRPVGSGLLVTGRLEKGEFQVEKQAEFDEPRHLHILPDGGLLMTEIDRLLFLNPDTFAVDDIITHPYFAFLHTIDVSADGRYGLVVSSGYDAVFEVDLSAREVVSGWFAWEHGFNPDADGVWLAASPERAEQYEREGKDALYVDCADYGRQGLLTARRTAHPNMAVYDPYDDERSFLVSAGHDGGIYRVNRDDLETQKMYEVGDQMPHGLRPFEGGWCITNTVRGEWWLLDRDFNLQEVYSVAEMGGKVPGTEDVEWVQQAVPVGENYVLFLDANRGLIAVDRKNKEYSIYQPDPNWCIQDALPF
ncbi:MAG: hypothetical protein KGZ25_08920 [Planctomycetes bacterium]|nr:hypothetical protein [Planctomycetota bacterium]